MLADTIMVPTPLYTNLKLIFKLTEENIRNLELNH